MLEVDDRGTQDESMSELKQEIEELKNKPQEEKEKTNVLVIQLDEMKQQLVNFTTRCGNFEKKSFSLNRFKNDKSMGFYTGFADGEIFNVLYNFFDSGEDGGNIRGTCFRLLRHDFSLYKTSFLRGLPLYRRALLPKK